MKIILEILVILMLIMLNGLLAMAEFSVIAARKSLLRKRAREGDQGAAAALILAKEPADFLAAVQIGITLVGVLAGAFGGATIAAILASWIQTFPLIAPYSSGIAVGLVVILITITSLIFGELVPKRLALTNPEAFAALLANPMKRLSKIMSPLVRILSGMTDLVLKLMGVKPKVEIPASEEEIRILIAQATQAGNLPHTGRESCYGCFPPGRPACGFVYHPSDRDRVVGSG